MLDASRHLSMDRKDVKDENKLIHQEAREELKTVEAKIAELENKVPKNRKARSMGTKIFGLKMKTRNNSMKNGDGSGS